MPEINGLPIYLFVEANVPFISSMTFNAVNEWYQGTFQNYMAVKPRFRCTGVVAFTSQVGGQTVVGEATGLNKGRKILRLSKALEEKTMVFHTTFHSIPDTPSSAQRAFEMMKNQLLAFKQEVDQNRRTPIYSGKQGGANDDYVLALAFQAEMCAVKPYLSRQIMDMTLL